VTPGQIKGLVLIDLHEPIPDFAAPSPDQIDRIVGFMKTSISSRDRIGVPCGAGIGRTGTILACYLVSNGSIRNKPWKI